MTTDSKVTAITTATKPANQNQFGTTSQAKPGEKPMAKESTSKTSFGTTKKAKAAPKKKSKSKAKTTRKTTARKSASKATPKAKTTTAKKTAPTQKSSSQKPTAAWPSSAQPISFKKATDQATKSFNEAFSQSNEQIKACMECSNITADAAKAFTNEWMRFTNESFSDNMELSKDMFTCRTINDVFDLHNKLVRSNLDHFFNQSVKFSEMMFQYASDAAEPMNESFASTTKKFNKSFAA